MSAHTRGPWESTPSANEAGYARYCVFARNERIAIVDRIDDGSGYPNARLIAAAPDLLAALEGIIEIGKRDLTNPKYDAYFEEARAALKKARGGR